MVRWFGTLGLGCGAEQLAAALELSAASTVSEESEVANADQSFGQNVKKKSAQELICRNGHDLLLATANAAASAAPEA